MLLQSLQATRQRGNEATSEYSYKLQALEAAINRESRTKEPETWNLKLRTKN